MSLFTLLLVGAGTFMYLNTRFLKLPDTIGVMRVSVILISLNGLNPVWFQYVRQNIAQIDFGRILFDVMLSFLLFAGAFHTDANLLRIERRSAVLFTSIGFIISTFLVGTGLYYVVNGLGNAT